MKKIAVLTSGGDAPGMNACIRAIVRSGTRQGLEIYASKQGFKGLIENNFIKLDGKSVGNIIQTGGTIIKTSRCREFETADGFKKAVKNLKDNNFDYLIVIGGDGSFGGAEKLSKFINVIAIPGTIDNDLGFTDRTIGFDTAVNTIVSLMNNIRDTSSSHERLSIVEVMGANCGDIALHSGISSGAEIILVPEIKISENDILKEIKNIYDAGRRSIIVVLAEGVCSAEHLQKIVKEKLQIDGRAINIGHIQRGGSPTSNDRIFATMLGIKAIENILACNRNIALGIKNGEYIAIDLKSAIKQKKKFNTELYNSNKLL